MKDFFSKLARIFKNKWVKFGLVSVIYTLWFVVWSRNIWMLLGLPVIFDIYISKYIYRLLRIDKHKARKAASKTYRETWSWISAIVFAVVAASLIHIYVFQMYKIPTSSMEKTLLVGDYLYVSKLAFGPKMPNTPLSLPLVHNTMPFSKTGAKSYSEAVKRPYKRIAGFSDVKRGDIVVFNFPGGDTVILEDPGAYYYDVLKQYQASYGEKRGRDILHKNFHIISRPVDKRENYVKRCVAAPGDVLEINSSVLYINGEQSADIPGLQLWYNIKISGNPFSRSFIESLGLSSEDYHYDRATQTYIMALTENNLAKISAMSNVISATKEESMLGAGRTFPQGTTWDEDNYGPIWIPAKGSTVELTTDNLPLYERIISIYEGNELEVKNGIIYINGAVADSYTFGMDYYFMMGDNRHNSLDSRFWGFVPEDHIVGRPSMVILSTNKEKKFPSNIRRNRLFHIPR